MADERPFASLEELLMRADRIWRSLAVDDWIEAFASHPKIGEKSAARPTSQDARAWAEQEQSGARVGSDAALRALAELNKEYEEKFGYIYIVCATGKSSEEMLAILKQRMDNAPEEELTVAAAEQAKITQLRLKKLLEQ
jgi:OHCU decarboxylase